MWRTTATELFAIDVPLVLAPLAGGPGTPELAAAVSSAGGLGMLGLGYDPPETCRAVIRRVRDLTDRPFGVNLFLPQQPRVDREVLERAAAALAPYRRELGLEAPPATPDPVPDFDAQLDAVIAERVPVVGFTFGAPDPRTAAQVKGSGALLVATTNSVAEAVVLVAAGVDAVVAQSAEAGGHRGGWLADADAEPVGLVALLPAVVDAVPVPVIAAGGIMDGRGLVAALALGAAGAQLGTAFLRCPEAGTSAPYRAALAAADETNTVVTKAFSGKPARGIRNRFAEAFPAVTPLPPYPLLHTLTRDLRRAAATAGRADLLSLWAGQGVRLGRELPAAELVATIVDDARTVMARLAAG